MNCIPDTFIIAAKPDTDPLGEEAEKLQETSGSLLHPGQFSDHPLLFLIYFIEVQSIYNAVLIYIVQQSDSVIHTHTHTHTHIYTCTFFFIFFSITVYHRILNVVPCALGPCCFPTLLKNSLLTQIPNPSLPLGNHKSVFCVCESLFISQISSLVSYFRFHILLISYICLCLTYFAQQDNLQVHPCCCK